MMLQDTYVCPDPGPRQKGHGPPGTTPGPKARARPQAPAPGPQGGLGTFGPSGCHHACEGLFVTPIDTGPCEISRPHGASAMLTLWYAPTARLPMEVAIRTYVLCYTCNLLHLNATSDIRMQHLTSQVVVSTEGRPPICARPWQ